LQEQVIDTQVDASQMLEQRSAGDYRDNCA